MYKNIQECVPELENIENELIDKLNIYDVQDHNFYHEQKNENNNIYEYKNNNILLDDDHYLKQKNVDDIKKEIEYEKYKQKYK